jgi:hypothetical protein
MDTSSVSLIGTVLARFTEAGGATMLEQFKAEMREAVLKAINGVVEENFPRTGHLPAAVTVAELSRAVEIGRALDAHAELVFSRLSGDLAAWRAAITAAKASSASP